MANEVVFDNTVYGFDTPNSSSDTLAAGGAASAGFSFTSSSGGPGTIADLKIGLDDYYIKGSSTVTAYLYSNDLNINQPDMKLATLGTIDQTSFSQDSYDKIVDFGSSDYILTSNTRYWVILKETSVNKLIGTAIGKIDAPANPQVSSEYVEYTDSNGNATISQYSDTTQPITAEISENVTCFTTGTRLRTQRGNIPVDDLAVCDVAQTVSGTFRPIRWIGRREMDCTARDAPHEAWPVRIRAGAFGADLPTRDLTLSPGHPVLVGGDDDGDGGHLVPIMCLINGTSIARVPVDTVTYWHVELDQHDILLAEGLPAESYLDWGDRAFFTEAADHALANPDFVVPGLAGRCRPVAIDGPIVEAERRRLDAVFAMSLAEACAWPGDEDAVSIDATVGPTPNELGRAGPPMDTAGGALST